LGAVFILVVRFAPKGLAGLFEYALSFIPYRVRETSKSRTDVPAPSE
ncbi:MAG: hypothetical protein CFH38_00353, partial [Alphaproteobacteria bacterium MarineAlpha10_Bin1]